MARVYGKNVNLDGKNVLSFFKERANADTPIPLNKVIYQDNNPSLAEQRDLHEKQIALPLLSPVAGDRVLDVGCGIGRWVESFKDTVELYFGTDFCDDFIRIAKETHAKSGEKIMFKTLSAQEVSRESLGTDEFTIVLVIGVLMYLNDSEVVSVLENLKKLAKKSGTRIYIREPIALVERLTLSEHFSEELNTSYHAIYRTESELMKMMNQAFGGEKGLRLVASDFLFSQNLANRVETTQKYFIWGC